MMTSDAMTTAEEAAERDELARLQYRPRRSPRPFQFSLRAVLLFVTASAMAFGLVRYLDFTPGIVLVPMFVVGFPLMITGFGLQRDGRPFYSIISAILALVGTVLVLIPTLIGLGLSLFLLSEVLRWIGLG